MDKILPLESPCALLLAEFIRVITRAKLVQWGLADANDPEEGFGADLDLGSDISIGVRRAGDGFTAGVVFILDEPAMQPTEDGGADINFPEEINAAIDEDLYLEVEDNYNATKK
jgi:hypothetical protein